MPTLRIATRGSPLALWQARHVADALQAAHGEMRCELVAMRTEGDKLLDAPLAKVGGKGLFVKELEHALLDGRADLAVHSMKDVPVSLPDGLHLPVIMERADPRDALVSTRAASLDALQTGARVGTSSLRRRCQLMALRPDLQVANLRGGVASRLAKLDGGEFDAILLASAGLDRLNKQDRISERLCPERLIPAIGQGAMGIECRRDDAEIEALISALLHADSAIRVLAERAMNRRLEGGCQVPIAGYATLEGDRLRLCGLVASLDGRRVIRHDAEASRGDGERLGARVAEALLRDGADEILSEVYGQFQ